MPSLDYDLASACDLAATALVNLADIEELAQTLHGHKKKVRPVQQVAQRAGITEKVLAGLFTDSFNGQ